MSLEVKKVASIPQFKSLSLPQASGGGVAVVMGSNPLRKRKLPPFLNFF